MQYSGLFIGLTTIDIQYFVDSFPEPNKKIKTKPPEILVGGPSTNAAVAFAYLNGGAFLASATGNNSFSGFIKNDFKDTGVKHINLDENSEINAVLATVVTSEINGDRNIFTHHPPSLKANNIETGKLFTEVKPQIVMLDGFYPETAIDAAKMAGIQNIPVVLDCGSWKPQYEQLLNYSDIVICSEDFYPPGCRNTMETMYYLQEKAIKKFAVSRGEKAIVYFDDGITGTIPIQKVPVTDTLGAGDFLHGAFCFYYLQLNDFKKALHNASQIAGKSCMYSGTRKWLNFKE